MPPEPRFVPRFVAEPPQDPRPYGRWAQRLRDAFAAACADLDVDPTEVGETGEVSFFPDRTWAGRTYLPVTAPTSTGLELFGTVSYVPAASGEEPTDLRATADVTAETAAANPGWALDLCDETLGPWRGEEGRGAEMVLVWGTALVPGGAVATAELADLAVDQCLLEEGRFTLVGLDAYRGDELEIKLFNRRGDELAREGLYADEEDAED